MKKYFLTIKSENGKIIYDHSSDFPFVLLSGAQKAAFDGAYLLADFFNCSACTNLPSLYCPNFVSKFEDVLQREFDLSRAENLL